MILSAVPGARPIPRRTMVQYLDLGVYDLLAPRLPTQLHRKTSDGQLRFESAFRIRNDFGEWVTQAQGSTARLIQATDQRQLDLLYGYLEGQNLGGLVNFRLGRQFDNSALDFLAVDGAWLELRTPSLGGIHLVAQGLGGYQARLNNWMGYAAFEFQGTDPTTARRGWRTPVVGGSIRVDVGDRASMRVGIRRTASTQDDPTASLELGNRGSVSQLAGFSLDEKVAFVTSHVELVKRVAHLTANARYNLATSRADIIDVGLTWTAGQDAFARLPYLRTLPIFDLDSIFNVFDLRAFEDVRMQLTRKLNPKWDLDARGEMQFDRLYHQYRSIFCG